MFIDMGKANDKERINRILSILKYKLRRGLKIGLCNDIASLFCEIPEEQHMNRITTAVIGHAAFVSSCFGENPYYMNVFPSRHNKSYITTRERLLKTLSDNWVSLSDCIIAMNNLLVYVDDTVYLDNIFDGFRLFVEERGEKKLCLFFEYIQILEEYGGHKRELMYFKYIFSILKLSLLLDQTSLKEKEMENLDLFLSLIRCDYIEDLLFKIE